MKSNETVGKYGQRYFVLACGDGSLPGNALDFHQHVLGKSGHFDSRPGGLMVAEGLFIDAVDGDKIIHRLEEHLNRRWSGTKYEMKVNVPTVVFTTFPRSLPDASTTARRFFSACFACSSTPPVTISPVAGSSGMFPETNKRSRNFMAWEYGPTAPGASATGVSGSFTEEGEQAHWK